MMKKSIGLRGLFFAIALLASLLTFAQVQTRKVVFPKGKSNTSIKSSIKGYQTIDYVVNAKQGQTLAVKLTTKNGANYFNVLPPGSNDVADFIGETSGYNYSASLSASGDWKIRVYLMRSAARRNESTSFTLDIAVTN